MFKQGAVGLRIRLYGRTMCFVNCHFAAHLEAVNRRNADFDHVYRTMTFSRPNYLNCAAGTTPVPFLYCSLLSSMLCFGPFIDACCSCFLLQLLLHLLSNCLVVQMYVHTIIICCLLIFRLCVNNHFLPTIFSKEKKK